MTICFLSFFLSHSVQFPNVWFIYELLVVLACIWHFLQPPKLKVARVNLLICIHGVCGGNQVCFDSLQVTAPEQLSANRAESKSIHRCLALMSKMQLDHFKTNTSNSSLHSNN